MVLGLSASIPLLLLENPALSIADAIFESMSGLTTTGATVLTSIETLPPSILFYRQQLQWFGGMGIGVGSFDLGRAHDLFYRTGTCLWADCDPTDIYCNRSRLSGVEQTVFFLGL